MNRDNPLRPHMLQLMAVVSLSFLAFVIAILGESASAHRREELQNGRNEVAQIATSASSIWGNIHAQLSLIALRLGSQREPLGCGVIVHDALHLDPSIESFTLVSSGRSITCRRHPSAIPEKHKARNAVTPNATSGDNGEAGMSYVLEGRNGNRRGELIVSINLFRLLADSSAILPLANETIELVDGKNRPVAFLGPAVAKTNTIPNEFSAPVRGTDWTIRILMPALALTIPPGTPSLLLLALLFAGVAVGGVLLVARRSPEARALVGGSLKTFNEAARYDTLTGLPNREAFLRKLIPAMRHAESNEHLLALLMLDLDRFKTVNDTLGHTVGDTLIGMVAMRLQAVCEGCGHLSRSGGDEFAVILEGVASADMAETMAESLLDAVSHPYQLDSYELYVTTSIGVALYPLGEASPEQLVAYADIAMSHAKNAGRNRFEFYSRKMSSRSFHRLMQESSLRGALERNEFVLHYQPQFDAATGGIVGAEALLRWNHPEWGLVPPGDFIPILEETGLVVDVGYWALRSACAQAVKWQRDGYGTLRVAINLSALQLRQGDLAEAIIAILAETGLAPENLELELTESLLMEEAESPLETLTALRSTGVNIAIDDFGTGYSSLSYLKRFPVDALKIDREFIRDIECDRAGNTIVGAIVRLAHGLGFRVVAEGVESSGQLAILREHGCDEIQGFLLGRPVPAENLPLLTSHYQEPPPNESMPNL